MNSQQAKVAVYAQTDWPVMQALTHAADRGVKVRLYLDSTQFAERAPTKVFRDLADTPSVEIRTKHRPAAPMHLKSYQSDGKLLRTGAANFSATGLKRQDNDLIVIESADAAAAFERNFEARFAGGNLYRQVQINRPAPSSPPKMARVAPFVPMCSIIARTHQSIHIT